jgi:hypothetical protein
LTEGAACLAEVTATGFMASENTGLPTKCDRLGTLRQNHSVFMLTIVYDALKALQVPAVISDENLK